MKRIKPWMYGLFLLVAVTALLSLFPWIHVPRTVQFDDSLPYTEIGGYKYHTEIFGKPEATPVIVVHGGPGIDYAHLKTLVPLSKNYRVIFYDQRGAGLSPRVSKSELTLDKSLEDLHSIVEHFSKGKKVKLIGHSWGGMLVVGYLSKHPERVSQAVVVEPGPLYPGAAKEWVEKFNQARSISLWAIAPHLAAYPFVVKEDGQEGSDYVMTKVSNERIPGPPYECPGRTIPADMFKRGGYESFNGILKPIMDKPESFPYDLTTGIAEYRGDLMLISSACSILGSVFQEKYHIPKLPVRTMHVKTENMGHNLLTEDAEWSLKTLGRFFKP